MTNTTLIIRYFISLKVIIITSKTKKQRNITTTQSLKIYLLEITLYIEF